jgi:hypothetical protein
MICGFYMCLELVYMCSYSRTVDWEREVQVFLAFYIVLVYVFAFWLVPMASLLNITLEGNQKFSSKNYNMWK